MTIWVITAIYQGVYDGIEFATLDEDKAMDKYRQLVRDAVGFRGRDNPWEDVETKYESRIENCGKIEEYYLEEVEVQ